MIPRYEKQFRPPPFKQKGVGGFSHKIWLIFDRFLGWAEEKGQPRMQLLARASCSKHGLQHAVLENGNVIQNPNAEGEAGGIDRYQQVLQNPNAEGDADTGGIHRCQQVHLHNHM